MNMTYTKPELVLLADAREAIQGTQSKDGGPLQTQVHPTSIAAYEADE